MPMIHDPVSEKCTVLVGEDLLWLEHKGETKIAPAGLRDCKMSHSVRILVESHQYSNMTWNKIGEIQRRSCRLMVTLQCWYIWWERQFNTSALICGCSSCPVHLDQYGCQRCSLKLLLGAHYKAKLNRIGGCLYGLCKCVCVRICECIFLKYLPINPKAMRRFELQRFNQPEA